MQTDGLLQAKQQVHIMYGLSARTLQQVVDHGDDQQFIVDALQVDQALIGIHHLLQIRILVGNEGKVMVIIILLVDACDFAQVDLAIQIHRSEDASREVAAHRDEIHLALEAILQLAQALVDLGQVLMLEWLIDRDVVVAPAEMRGSRRLHTRSGRTRDRIHMHIRVKHQMLG